MSKQTLLSLVVEFFWLILVILFAVAVTVPLLKVLQFESLKLNFLHVLALGLAFRYVLYFKKITYLKPFVFRIILAVVAVAAGLLIYQDLKEMIFHLDNYGVEAFVKKDIEVKDAEIKQVFALFKKEFILFSVGGLILLALLEIRLILSFLSDLRKIK